MPEKEHLTVNVTVPFTPSMKKRLDRAASHVEGQPSLSKFIRIAALKYAELIERENSAATVAANG
jgi:hypothetical protein